MANQDKTPNNSNTEKRHGGGPKTPEGKARSAMNATRHGLTGKAVVLTTEDPEKFEELLRDYLAFYAPANPIELDLVHEITVSRWRLQRIWGMESTMFEITMERSERAVNAEFKTCDPTTRMTLAYMSMTQDNTSLATLHRYEARLARRYHQLLKELQTVQSNRKKQDCQTNSAPARPRPILLPQPAAERVPERPYIPKLPVKNGNILDDDVPKAS